MTHNRLLGIGSIVAGVAILTFGSYFFLSTTKSKISGDPSQFLALFPSPPVRCSFSFPSYNSQVDQDTYVINTFSVTAAGKNSNEPVTANKLVYLTVDGTSYETGDGIPDKFVPYRIFLDSISSIGWPLGEHTLNAVIQTNKGYCRATTKFTAIGVNTVASYGNKIPYYKPTSTDLIPTEKFIKTIVNSYNEKNGIDTESNQRRITVKIAAIIPYANDIFTEGEISAREKQAIIQELSFRIFLFFQQKAEQYGFNNVPLEIEFGNILLVRESDIYGVRQIKYASDESRIYGTGYSAAVPLPRASDLRRRYYIDPSYVPFIIVDHIINSDGNLLHIANGTGYFSPHPRNTGLIEIGALRYDEAYEENGENGDVRNFLYYPPNEYVNDEEFHNIERTNAIARQIAIFLGLGDWHKETQSPNKKNLLFPVYIDRGHRLSGELGTLEIEQVCKLKAYAAWDFPEYIGSFPFFVENPIPRYKSCGNGLLQSFDDNEQCELSFWNGFNDVVINQFGREVNDWLSENGSFALSCEQNHDPADADCTDDTEDEQCGFVFYEKESKAPHCYQTGPLTGKNCVLEIPCGNNRFDTKDGEPFHETCDYTVPESIPAPYDTCVEYINQDGSPGPQGCEWLIDLDGNAPPIGPGDQDSGWQRPNLSPSPKPCKCLSALTADCKIIEDCSGETEEICTEQDTCTLRCGQNTIDPEDDTTVTYDCAWRP